MRCTQAQFDAWLCGVALSFLTLSVLTIPTQYARANDDPCDEVVCQPGYVCVDGDCVQQGIPCNVNLCANGGLNCSTLPTTSCMPGNQGIQCPYSTCGCLCKPNGIRCGCQ